MKTLDPAQRRALRAQAHHLHPVVSIGHQGLTPAVLHEIDLSLLAHELVKIRVFSDERAEREALLQQVCEALDAAPVQHLGKVLVLFRAAPAEAREEKSATARHRRPGPADARRRESGPARPGAAAGRAQPAAAKALAPAATKAGRRHRIEPLTAGKARELTGNGGRKSGSGSTAERRSPLGAAKGKAARGGAGSRRSGAGAAPKGRTATGSPAAHRRSPAAPPTGVPRAPRVRRRRG